MLDFCRLLRLLYNGAISWVKLRSGDAQRIYFAHVAQSVEHVLGKDEVISSILIMGSILEGSNEGNEDLQRDRRG